MNLENTLWMGGILPGMTEINILNSFRFYNIFPTGIKLIKDKQKNKNKSYCFISFKSFQEANNVLQYLNGKRIPNSEINFNLNWADYQGAKTAYVGNLNLNVTKEDLFSFFKMRYKSVQNARVIYGDNGISKGFGFVVFKNEDEYLKCLKEMNGIYFYGNFIKVREQIKKEDNRKRNNLNNDKNSNDNVLIKKNTININDIIIQNNIINNNNIINYNQNNMNINNIENNNIKINGFNSINNRYENNNIISKIQSDKININNSESLSKIIEDNKSNFKSNQIIDDLVNKINSSSIFLNINKNNKISKMDENSNKQQINNNKQNILNEKMIKKENKKRELKLEILEKIDEITLNKKIHESILKTLSYQKMLYIKEGIKFKSK
jgi:RNA recognition motif-containing protein